MNYVYKQKQIWVVGFYDPNGKWNQESEFENSNQAAERTAWLNGLASPKEKSSDFFKDLKTTLKKIFDEDEKKYLN